jgi:excisionase family DNA binding protein
MNLIQHPILTPEEVAAYLRVAPQTAYRLLRSGELPGVKIGKQWRILRVDLDAYLHGKSTESQDIAAG